MSKSRTKEELTRLAWITELRRQGHRQCREYYHKGGNRVCALGLLGETAGLEVHDLGGMMQEEIGAMAGLTGAQTGEVALRNDGDDGYRAHTFAQIADVVAGWFPST